MAPTTCSPSFAETFTQHPRGLWVLAVTEIWERFSFYGVRALLVLYLTSGALDHDRFKDVAGARVVYFFFGRPANEVEVYALASAINEWYSGMAFVTPLFGGWMADRRMERTDRGRIQVSALGMLLIIPAMFGVGFSPQTGQLWVAVAFLILFGVGWGFFDANNMPILCQVARPEHRATGYGLMNLVSISAGGLADWGFGAMRMAKVPLMGIFSIFASAAAVSVVLVLLIRPRDTESR